MKPTVMLPLLQKKPAPWLQKLQSSATHAADEADHEALELNAGLAFGQLYVGDLIVA